MMNQIPRKQNETHALNLLFTQRLWYSVAKTFFGWRAVVVLIIAIVGPFFTTVEPNAGAYVGIVAIAFLLLDNAFLEIQESNKRLQAAKAQELFDIDVFELPWNSVVCGKQPDPELLGEAINSEPGKDYSKLKDWYSPDVGKVGIELGRLLCQRSNAWWDTTLRRRYIMALVLILTLSVIAAIIISVIFKLTVSQLISGVFVPFLPLFEVAIKQIKENSESAKTTAEIQAGIDEAIEKAIEGENSALSDARSRTFQDAIFRHRIKCPMIPDWAYWLAREPQESQMRFGIESMVRQYLQRTSR